jgi:hypothetical protein
LIIHYHDPIGSLVYRRFRMNVDAGGILATLPLRV